MKMNLQKWEPDTSDGSGALWRIPRGRTATGTRGPVRPVPSPSSERAGLFRVH
jgi:hypothetical protein